MKYNPQEHVDTMETEGAQGGFGPFVARAAQGGFAAHCKSIMNSMKLVIPLHFIS